MKQSPHLLSTKRIVRKLWNSEDESKRREAIEVLTYACYYEMCEEQPDKSLWS